MKDRVPPRYIHSQFLPAHGILYQQVRRTVASNADQFSRHQGKRVSVVFETEEMHGKMSFISRKLDACSVEPLRLAELGFHLLGKHNATLVGCSLVFQLGVLSYHL